MLSNFKKLILSINVTAEERDHFILICSDWMLYCEAVSRFNKLKIMKLLNYLVEERPKSKRLLDRCISRFNRLNALGREVLK